MSAIAAAFPQHAIAVNRHEGDHHKRLRYAEDLSLSLALASLVVIPLAEVVSRRLFRSGISGAPYLVQHLTLIVSVVGGAIAARENRLLALSTLLDKLKGIRRDVLGIFCGAVASAVSASLCIAATQFVAAEREAVRVIAYGIPLWVVQATLPIGFGIITIRLLGHSSPEWMGRTIAAALACMLVAMIALPPLAPSHLVFPALFILAVATLLGVPVFVTLGGAALILLWGRDVPIASLPIDQYSLVTNPSIPAIPLFTIAGYFLAEGGAPKRLIRLFRALFGRIAGGSAIVTALTCAFFTSFTGASGVTIVALGGLLMPVLLAEQYSERAALGLVTGAGSLGLLLPPCLPLILYAIVAQVRLEQMFLGGLLPGFLV